MVTRHFFPAGPLATHRVPEPPCFPNPVLTIDEWREVAAAAMDFIERFAAVVPGIGVV
jgi:hypothetical protein